MCNDFDLQGCTPWYGDDISQSITFSNPTSIAYDTTLQSYFVTNTDNSSVAICEEDRSVCEYSDIGQPAYGFLIDSLGNNIIGSDGDLSNSSVVTCTDEALSTCTNASPWLSAPEAISGAEGRYFVGFDGGWYACDSWASENMDLSTCTQFGGISNPTSIVYAVYDSGSAYYISDEGSNAVLICPDYAAMTTATCISVSWFAPAETVNNIAYVDATPVGGSPAQYWYITTTDYLDNPKLYICDDPDLAQIDCDGKFCMHCIVLHST